MKHWKCSYCGETVDASLAVCWNCGTSAAGERDNDFAQWVDKDPPYDGPLVTPPRFSLRNLLLVMSSCCLVLALIRLELIGDELAEFPVILLATIFLVVKFLRFALRQPPRDHYLRQGKQDDEAS
ncbi:MAG: hypothetical protein KDA42_12780 [Planctomycetales bacterium]|nr:hypothetical protein [Planctomycetales bacterium]